MGKVQTRRTISIRGETYERLRAWCEKHSESMSEVVETLLAGRIGAGTGYRPFPAAGVGRQAPDVAKPLDSPPPPPTAPPIPPIAPCPAPAPVKRLMMPAGAPPVRSLESYRPIRSAAVRPARGNLGAPSPLPRGVRIHRQDAPIEDITDHRRLQF